MDYFKKFRNLLDDRDTKIQNHFGNQLHEMLNYPEQRFWYTQNIFPLDKKIISVANSILKNIIKEPTILKSVQEVYSNQRLTTWFNNELEKEQQLENEF